MRILPANNFSNTSFQSRNKTIRFAENIIRIAENNYPMISSTYIHSYKCVPYFSKAEINLDYKVAEVRNIIYRRFTFAKNLEEKILSFLDPLKTHKTGNCGEFSELACIIAKMNGLDNCYLALLETDCGIDVDHEVLYVDDRKPYIIDYWLKFADFADNAITKYKNEYKIHFDGDISGDKLVFKKVCSKYANFLNNLSAEEIDKLKLLFPELIISKEKIRLKLNYTT